MQLLEERSLALAHGKHITTNLNARDVLDHLRSNKNGIWVLKSEAEAVRTMLRMVFGDEEVVPIMIKKDPKDTDNLHQEGAVLFSSGGEGTDRYAYLFWTLKWRRP